MVMKFLAKNKTYIEYIGKMYLAISFKMIKHYLISIRIHHYQHHHRQNNH